MIFPPHSVFRLRRSIVATVAAAALLGACGGSDDEPATPAAPAEESTDEATTENPLGDGTDNAPIGVDEEGNIDFSDEIDDAIDVAGFETVAKTIAGQLDPEPDVTIDGNDARFTFSEGTVDSNAWLPCSVANALLTDGQTLTVVYPDGEQLCE